MHYTSVQVPLPWDKDCVSACFQGTETDKLLKLDILTPNVPVVLGIFRNGLLCIGVCLFVGWLLNAPATC